jgi:1,2-phenylacetyl-CoA epoxidase catalytic subunit
VAINALVDTALSIQFEALRESTYGPLRQRVEKMLDEEQFHAAHAAAWFNRIARSAGCDLLQAAVQDILPVVLRWFGPDSTRSRALQNASIASAAGSTLRNRFLERIAPLLAEIDAGGIVASIEPDFDGFDEATRRVNGNGPDARTIARVRGDLNREFLLD